MGEGRVGPEDDLQVGKDIWKWLQSGDKGAKKRLDLWKHQQALMQA